MQTVAHSIPTTANQLVYGGIVLLHGFIFLALPLLLGQSPWWALLIPALAWVNATHWALIHEAIHKHLHPDAVTNERQGRILSILMGTSLHVLRYGHLMHHQLNRDWHSEWVQEKSTASKISYYWHLLFGLYVSEVATAALLAILPKHIALKWAERTVYRHTPEALAGGERFFYSRNNIKPLRHDMAAVLILYGAAFWNYGAWWPALLAFLAARALVVSFLDNIYHYETPADNSKAGKELFLPGLFSGLILHGNYHETHHLNPSVPWTELPTTHDHQNRRFNGRFTRHALMQFNGPLARHANQHPDSFAGMLRA